jgi:hypothetical protein
MANISDHTRRWRPWGPEVINNAFEAFTATDPSSRWPDKDGKLWRADGKSQQRESLKAYTQQRCVLNLSYQHVSEGSIMPDSNIEKLKKAALDKIAQNAKQIAAIKKQAAEAIKKIDDTVKKG